MIDIIPNWHPVFVHFTVALLVVSAAMHFLSHFISSGKLADQLMTVARWNLWIGVGFTLFTVAAGWYAYNTVAHDTPSHIAMTEHRNWAMATFVLFLGIAGWDYYLFRRSAAKGWLFTALMATGAALLLTTAWHGGELVYRHGLGVVSLPEPAAETGHAHDSEPHPHEGVDFHEH
jgi:uncharacterized membrane protein